MLLKAALNSSHGECGRRMNFCEVNLINDKRANRFWLCTGAALCRVHVTEQECAALFLRMYILHPIHAFRSIKLLPPACPNVPNDVRWILWVAWG